MKALTPNGGIVPEDAQLCMFVGEGCLDIPGFRYTDNKVLYEFKLDEDEMRSLAVHGRIRLWLWTPDGRPQPCALQVPEMAITQDSEPERYTGPIELGQHFIWESDNKRAWAHVCVVGIDEKDSSGTPYDERIIYTITVHGGAINPAGQKVWNEESRFRQACRPCDPQGRPL